jgi:polar amino acid transport system substrate-binding protein
MKKAILATAIAMFYVSIAICAWAGPAFDRIVEKKILRVGTSGAQPPMTATTKSGEIIGMDIDLAKAIAEAMEVKLELVKLPFADLLPALKGGKVDMVLSGMTITPERNTEVAFYGPYYISGKGILAVSEKYAAIREATGLNSPEVSIAALKNSTSQKFAETITAKAKLHLADSYKDATDLLFQGKIDVLVADYPYCALAAYRYKEKGLIAGENPLTFEPIGIAMPEDPLLVNWVGNFISVLRETGFLKKLHEKWLRGGPWIEELP